MAFPALSEMSDLINRRRSGIGGGQNGRDHAHRDADFDQLFFRQFAQNADGFHAAHAARKPVGGQQVLDVLVFGVAVSGLFDGEIGQALGMGARRRCHPLHDGVHLFLRIGAVLLPGCVCLLDLGADFLDRERGLYLPASGRYFLSPPVGRHFSTSSWGRGMTCTLTSSPTRRAAAAPASVAAFDRADIAAHGDADQARRRRIPCR